MESSVSIKDVIKSSILENFTTTISGGTIAQTVSRLLLALAIGIIIYLLYKASYRGVVYSESFAITLVGMTLITSSILIAISSNIVLSLGCVGALSIVRYRTAIKSPMDLMFLFLSVGVGICVGAGMLYIAILVVIIVALMLLLMSQVGFGDKMYVVIVHYEGSDPTHEIQHALGGNRYKIQSQTARKKDVEMAIEIRVKKGDLNFVDRIRAISFVKDVTVVQYNGDYIN
ncbi:MAG: DUF4956 domain-containing protein [Sphaerochaetaceae bacterium]|nr:DUF4956 domain-containing protein [Sphaerochaetaceae bacterium]